MYRKLCTIEEKFKAIKGYGAFGLDVVDMCLVPGVKISDKFKVPIFEKYKGVTCPKTHVRSFCVKMVAYFDDEKLFHFFRITLVGFRSSGTCNSNVSINSLGESWLKLS